MQLLAVCILQREQQGTLVTHQHYDEVAHPTMMDIWRLRKVPASAMAGMVPLEALSYYY